MRSCFEGSEVVEVVTTKIKSFGISMPSWWKFASVTDGTVTCISNRIPYTEDGMNWFPQMSDTFYQTTWNSVPEDQLQMAQICFHVNIFISYSSKGVRYSPLP